MGKKVLKILLMILCMPVLQGCSVSFSAGGEKETTAADSMAVVDVAATPKIEMEDMTLVLPDGMKYGIQDTEKGKTYYVWDTDSSQVAPEDEDIILYIYEGNDANSPDVELTNQEARLSIQSYIQSFKDTLNVRISADPDVMKNTDWYTFQFTGYSGAYETTSYGTMCYPKYYYGVYTLECLAEDYNRNFYGFIFSNNSKGEIMGKDEYDFIYGQIKESFSITEFYTLPQLEYDAAVDYSNGYSYEQFQEVFAEVHNYYGMRANNDNINKAYNFVSIENDFTVIVNDGVTDMSVKLIGLNIPIVNDDAVTDNGDMPGQAAEYARKLLDGKKVYLEYDEIEKDENGNNLVYIYLDDKTTMLNKVLLEKGFAEYAATEPKIKYAEEFAGLEGSARENGSGIWGEAEK